MKQTTKNGVLLLKKHKFWRNFSAAISVILLGFTVFFSGCKTLPAELDENKVDPLYLLDNESSFYMAIPAAADKKLIERIIKNNLRDVSDSDAKNLSDRITKVYCGLNRHKNHTEIQAAVEADVPLKYVPSIMSKKNGWETMEYVSAQTANKYNLYHKDSVDIAFPSKDLICLGRNLVGMVETYDYLKYNGDDCEDALFEPQLSDSLYDYLKTADNEIRFYANKPQSFLTILTGAQLNLQLVDVKGSFVTDPKHADQYLLSIEFNFKSEKYLKAGRSMLALAFSLANGQEEIESSTKLKISNIKLKKEQLYKIIVL